MTTSWADRYAQRARGLTSSTIRELLKLTQRAEVISFAGGMPAPELFPRERFAEACRRLMADPSAGAAALQYGPTEGYLPLREMIARHTARYGILAGPENVLITTGSQQALDLIAKLFVDPGDGVLLETPTYLGALQAFNVFGAEYVGLPTDDQGLCTDRLEAALRAGPRLMYVLPNFQNPSGATLSLERRVTLVALADRHGIPIVEDDPYGQLRYEGEHLPSLLVMDRDNPGREDGYRRGNVIYLSTFSKTLAPGLRLGWVVAPAEVIGKLVQVKQAADLHTSTFAQVVAHEVARGGFLDEHVRELRAVYRARRDVMLEALAANFPPGWGVTWTRPAGGLFLWMTLPAGLDSHRLLELALREDVAFVPGDSFFPCPEDGRRHMRLNFTHAKPEMIREGTRRLAVATRRLMEDRQPQAG